MKRSILIFGIIIVFAISIIVLSGCSSTNNITSQEVEDSIDEVIDSNEEEVMKDYTFKELSFKLPSAYGETESDNEDTVIYSTEIQGKIMKLFSLSTFDAGEVNFVEDASEGLAQQEFKLTGYETVSKAEPKKVDFNGIPALLVDVKYNNASVNGDAEVEYCYAQNGNNVYVICFEIFTQNGEKIGESDFSDSFDSIKDSFQFAE